MKYRLLRFSLLSMLVMLFGGTMFAQVTETPYKHTFSTTEKTFEADETKVLSNVSWTLSTVWFGENKDYNKDSSYGLKLGSNNKPVKDVVLTSKNGDIPGTITSVKVDSKIRSGAAVDMTVTVGGTAFKCNGAEKGAMSKDGSELEFTGNGSGSIVISCNTTSAQGSSGAIYIKTIEIAFDNSGTEYVKAPVISPADGTIFTTEKQEITIFSETQGATIYYTLNNGDEQTYSAPFDISETTTIKAYAKKAGMGDSQAVTATIKKKDLSKGFIFADFNDLTAQSSSSFNYTNADGEWVGVKMSSEVGFVKLGNSSTDGSITTPKSSLFTNNAVLSFKAKQYNNNEKTVNVSITGGGEISGDINVTELGTDFAEYTVNITGGTAETQLTISGSHRIYVDDIAIKEASTTPEEPEWTWRDIKIDLTNKNLLTEGEIAGINDETNKTPSMNIGVAVASDGTISRVANDAAEAAVVLTGKWHSNEHGWSNFSATVPVEGPVKITFGTCAWGGNVTVKDATGAEVVKAFTTNTGVCYHQNKETNVVSAYYKGEAATLTIAGGSYVPYFAVEAVDPADIPNDAKVTFDATNAGAEGVAPAEITAEIGSKVKIPANTSLFIEGKTLTAWTDGTNQYKAGDEVTVSEDMTLTPVFTANTVSFADRTTEVTALWDFQQKNGAVAQGIEGNTGIVVTQITIGNEAIDFPLNIDATSGKYNNKSWQDWAQINGGTLLKLPAYKGTVYSTFSMNDNSSTTFNGDAGTYAENVNTYTYEGSSEEMTINIQGGSYYRWLKAVYPAPTQEEGGFADIKVDLTNKNLLTEGEIAGINDETNKTPSMNIGIVVDAEGNISRVANDADNANAVLTGKWHSNDHGWSNFSATVPVEGPVKITFGTCAWGGNVTVKDATGAEVVKAFSTNTGACYHNNKDANIVSAYYKGDAATLTIAGGSYVPYFAVEAVDPADIPSETTVTFDAANAGAQGVAPAAQKVEIGSKVKIPANTSLYIEGKTLTAWTDGTNQYKAGDEVTVSEDMTLTPVFTANTVSFADRTTEVTALWDFQQKNGAVAQGIEGNTGIVVTQITIGNEAIDFPLNIDATSGKYNNKSWQDWAQINGGTLLKLPAYKGTVYSTFSMNDNSSTTFNGDAGTYAENVNTYTYEGSSEEMTINIQGGSYYRWLKAVYPAPTQDQGGFADIKIDLTNKNLLTEGEIAGINDETNKTPSMNIGVAVASDGTISRVDKDADNAAAVLTGKWHSNEHGWSNFSATVPVEGTVKITFGTCAWGGDVTVKNAEGATVATFNTNTGACYHNNKESNVVSAYYKQDVATTLTISGGSYVPYFAVEKVDPKDIPSDVKFVFDASESGAVGVAPEDATVGIGKTFTMPKNFTLYKEGYTLTAWTDGTNSYAVGEDMTAPDAETVTLTPVFTQNEVSLADRTEAVTVKWNFRRDQGAPAVGWEGQNGLIWVAQATIGDKTIDVALPFSTAPGKFNNKSNTDWVQINNGTTFHVPSCKGATISMEAYSDITTTTIDGQTDYTQGKTISYTIAGSAENVDVVIGDGSYYRYIQAVLPVVQSAGGETFDNVAGTITWPVGNETSGLISDNIKDAISATSVSVGNDLSASAAKYFDVDMVKYQPGTKNAGNVEGVMIEYRVKPKAGITFKPTNVSYDAVKVGTDGATFSWSYTINGQESTVTDVDAATVLRNNGANSSTASLNHSQEITADAANEFTFRFYISKTANDKQICIGNVIISGIVNGTVQDVAQYTLTAVASPEEGGSVNVYPAGGTYDEGTTLKLTATENFGYDFVNWTNEAGEEVSTDAVYTFDITKNETLTANFQAVETYELALTVDGTNDYMVTVSPAPDVVDGKWMYEAGTTVELTANQYEGLVTFTNWSDSETASNKIVKMDGNVTLTAIYTEADIIAGWDFYKAGNNGRKADFAAQDNEADALNLVKTETGDTGGWLDKSTEAGGGYESFKGAAVNWQKGTENGDVGNWHWQTKVNAEAFTDINVQFEMLYNYNAYQTYDAEYSFDGENWTKFGSITMEGVKNAASFKQQLPAECNNKAELYIRMKADKTSQVDGTASANDGNTLAMFFITGTPKIVDDGTAPVLVSTVPADNATGVSASGKIVLTFDERVKVVEGTVAYLNNSNIKSVTQNPMSPTVSGKVITFEYKGLDYGTKYNFVLAGKTVGDLTDNMIQNAIEFSFTTMERPTVEKGTYDKVVSNADELLAAIEEANNRADQTTRYRIFIKKGSYTIPLYSTMKTCNSYEVPECITFIKGKNISFIGESRDEVVITNGIDPNNTFAGTYGTTSKYDGIGNSDVFQITSAANGLYWQDLTVETGMADASGRDIAIQDLGTNNIYKNVGLRGYQDTWTSNNDNGLYYFEGGYLRGRTDFMCGKGDIFWNAVEIRQIKGGYAAVPSKPAKIGWVYKDCVINGEAGPAKFGEADQTAESVDGNYTLGRPWGSGTPVAVWIDTKMNVVPSAIGWNEMSGGWPKRFAEYNSMTSTGSQVDLSGRKKTFGDGHANNPVLTAEEAAEYSDMSKMYGEWDPTLATEQAPIVNDVKLTGGELTWTGSNYALLYAIVKNGEVIDFTTETTYNIGTAAGSRRAESTDQYQIRAANEMGGLNEASEVATATDGIETVNDNVNVNLNDNIYNLQGIRVNKAQKGVYIVNGRKVVIK